MVRFDHFFLDHSLQDVFKDFTIDLDGKETVGCNPQNW